MERGNEQDRRYSRKCTRARISNVGRNPDGNGTGDIRWKKKKRKRERRAEGGEGQGRVTWDSVRCLDTSGDIRGKDGGFGSRCLLTPNQESDFSSDFGYPPYVSHACTCSFKYVWETEQYLRAIASLVAI